MMPTVNALLFNILWSFVGFVVIRPILGGYFREKNRATFASAAIVIAFAAGAAWPFSLRAEAPAPSAPTAQTPSIAAGHGGPALATSTACAKSSLQPKTAAVGYVDTLSQSDSAPVPKTGGPPLLPGRDYRITGWAGDSVGGPPPVAVCLFVDGRAWPSQSAVGFQRADVAASLHAASMTDSGFQLEFSTSGLESGPHRLTVVSVSKSGAKGVLNGQWDVQTL